MKKSRSTEPISYQPNTEFAQIPFPPEKAIALSFWAAIGNTGATEVTRKSIGRHSALANLNVFLMHVNIKGYRQS
jgi:hypothetical protein